MKQFFEATAMASVLLLATCIVATVMLIVLDRYEVETCQKLKAQSTEGFSDFYITHLDKKMCDYHQILIDAPVR